MTALSAANSNITSLSSKKVEELSKRYKSESTKEIILKGYVVYWLYTDWLNMKTPASEVEDAAVPIDLVPEASTSDESQSRRNLKINTTELNSTVGYIKTKYVNYCIYLLNLISFILHYVAI